jgi:23S rRNA (pseudouridine1915-N3)-methyltransferase
MSRFSIDLRAIGHDKNSPTRTLCDTYLSRCQRPVRLHTFEANGDSRREQAWLAQDLPPRAALVLLDTDGTLWSSEALAAFLRTREEEGRAVIFFLGGANGLKPLRQTLPVHDSFSLGRLTLPHLLARVLLCEQLYRAECIERGHPYHRAG